MSGEVARPLLVGVDGSASALDAVGWAAREADRRHVGLRLVVAFGWVPAESNDDSITLVRSAQDDALRQAAEPHLEEAAAEAVALVPDVAVAQVVLTGHPTAVLVAESATAQLVVVGSRGRGPLAGLVLGSVSQAVLHHAASPVAGVH